MLTFLFIYAVITVLVFFMGCAIAMREAKSDVEKIIGVVFSIGCIITLALLYMFFFQ